MNALLEQMNRGNYGAFGFVVEWIAVRIAPKVHANWISGVRAAMVIPIIGLLILDRVTTAVVLYVVAALGDFLDGPVARRRRALELGDDPIQGAFVDALCDKLFLLSILIFVLCSESFTLSWWTTIIVLAVITVEVALVSARYWPRSAKLRVAKAQWAGKVKNWFECIGAGGLIVTIHEADHWGADLALVCLALSLPLALKSLWDKVRPNPP